MKKYGAMVAALFAALLGLAVLAPAAQATPVTYPAATFTVTANPQNVVAGGTFTLTSKSSINCVLVFSFNGTTQNGSGTSVTKTFTAPTTPGTYPANVTCTYDTTAGTIGHAIALTTATATRAVNITVTAATTTGTPSTTTTSGLPNTGGPSVWWWVAGSMAVVMGAFAMFTTRRKSNVSA